jgi:hypothetical protein
MLFTNVFQERVVKTDGLIATLQLLLVSTANTDKCREITAVIFSSLCRDEFAILAVAQVKQSDYFFF